MYLNYLFLFEYVPKESRVIIYGLGKIGNEYIEQIEETHWCKIVGVSDRSKRNPKYRNISIEEINRIPDFDYILIAIENKYIVSEVYDSLCNTGIDAAKILNLNIRHHIFPAMPRQRNRTIGQKIAFIVGGGLGDNIVSSSFYERLQDYIPNAQFYIIGKNKSYLKAIYGKKSNVADLCLYDDFKAGEECEYDLVLQLEHVANLRYLNSSVFPNEFLSKLDAYKAEYEEKYDSSDMGYRFLMRRMLIMGRNYYSALGGGDIFALSPELVRIDFDDKAEGKFNKYKLKHYITLNYGADRTGRETEDELRKGQIKMWPKELYAKWTYKFKLEYPDMEIVQIGAGDSVKIEGVDRYILGEDWEVVKYILRDSMFHLDCEGGLVHLATAIGTSCIVLFGPTPVEYYGYKKNINLHTGVCAGCMGLSDNWYYDCVNKNHQCCMYSITPDMVMDAARTILRK